MTARAVSFELNGEPVAALARPLETLQSVLRDQLGMTGTKAGCRQGGCGSCTVRLDGEPVLACLVPVEHVEGHSVTTIEGLGSADALSPVQATFYERFAIQCGFCSPGMIIGRDGAPRTQPGSHPRGDRRGARRQRLPLHRDRPDRRRDRGGGVTHARAGRGTGVNHAKPFNVIGRAHERRDGRGHVTGTTVYVDDISFPRMCHLKMVRNPLVHARIRGIDFSEAEQVPGFVTALTARDVPKNVYTILCLIGVEPDDEPVLAEDRVRYRGEQIAAVVAETEAAAAEAAAKVGSTSRSCRTCSTSRRRSPPARRWSRTGGRTTSSTKATTAAACATGTLRRPASGPTTSSRAATS